MQPIQAIKNNKWTAMSVIGLLPATVAAIFYMFSWLDTAYASTEQVAGLQEQQTELHQKFDKFEKKMEQNRLNNLIEKTEDDIYTLERIIRKEGDNARESDHRQLNKLKSRLERYKRELNKLSQ